MKKRIKYISTVLLICFLSCPMMQVLAYSKVTCGNSSQGLTKAFPAKFPSLTATAVSILEVAVPVILVIMGSIDFVKAVTSGKEDDMKKAQGTFIRRLGVGALVFVLFLMVKTVINIINIGDADSANGIVDCMNCFINSKCKVKK